MTIQTSHTALRLVLPMIAGVAALGAGLAFADAAPATTTASELPFRCGVVAAAQGASTQLQAVVESDTALSGIYRLSVTSSGGGNNSVVNQGGPFALAATQSATLGTVSINANASSAIVFELTVDGTTYSCAPVTA